ncbi:MAG: hypothetical protein EBQ85_07530 [Proteobacteria bacterium]|nr:hypothetical protein [Pseudomonadota bacterium]
MSVSSKLNVWFFSFFFLLAFNAFSEEPSDCWWPGCRVSLQAEGHASKTLSLRDDQYQHVGFPTPPTEAPRSHSIWSRPVDESSKNKKNFVILECDPYKNLQEGDILLQVGPITKDASSIYDLLMLSSHAAIVAKRPDGSLYALGTPRNYWPQGKLDYTSYHIIRLREFPSEITSAKVLQEWKSSPVKYQKIRDWQEKRKVILEKVKKGIEFFEKNPPYYDTWRNTQILDPKEKEKLTKMILLGDSSEEVPSQYCSELVATIYAVAGAQLPSIKSNQFYVDRLEKEVLPYFKKDGETNAEVFQRGLDAFFENRDLWRNLGASDDEIAKTLEDRANTGNRKLLPEKVAKVKKNFEWVWSYPAFIRNQLIYWGGTVGTGKGVITPLDFLDAVKDIKSDYSYVGTYLKEACEDPSKRPATEHVFQ